MKQIQIDIAPDGTVKIEAKGFQGVECLQATKALEDVLKRGKRTLKAEYFAATAGVGVAQTTKK